MLNLMNLFFLFDTLFVAFVIAPIIVFDLIFGTQFTTFLFTDTALDTIFGMHGGDGTA